MGIKFYCPSGHKLNVKSFLAGKKGVCPHCGERFRIPKHSTRGREKQQRDAAESEIPKSPFEFDSGILSAGPASATAVAPAATTSVASAPASAPATNAPALPPFPTTAAPKVAESDSAPAAPSFPAINPAPGPSIVPVGPAAPSNPLPASPIPAAAPATDPIAEAPSAVWYVRPPSGGQYGPARGDLMRGWIAEGRVSADSLVWRDGWADWRTASQVFPSLGGSVPAPLGGLSVPSAAPRAKPLYAKKKHTQSSSVAALICLVLVCMFLVALLAYVVMAVQ